MTRETKVGLLIGLGLILFIGIIVSDHLSQVQQPQTNNLTRFADQAQASIAAAPYPGAVDRAQSRQQDELALDATRDRGTAPSATGIPHSSQRPIPTPQEAEIAAEIQHTLTNMPPRVTALIYDTTDAAAEQAQAVTANRTDAIEDAPMTLIDRTRDIPVVVPTTSPPHPGSPTIHYVKPDESAWGLAQKYLGDGNKWRVLRAHNPDGIGSDGLLRVNARLIIPDRSVVANGPMTVAQRPADESARPGQVVVQSGDTLSVLAYQHMGSSRLWPKLLAANRKLLDAPEDLRVGMSLVIPSSSSRVIVRGDATPVRDDADPTDYTVQANDNLSGIARKKLGDASRWEEIFEANQDRLDSPDDLRVGQKLRIPD